MPEFRIRHKKKRDPRRHTLNGSDETAQQILAAKELVQQTEQQANSEEATGVPNAGEFTRTTSQSDPAVKALVVRKISSRSEDCFFLQHGSDMRRCPMPSPITLSTIKNLFVNMFDLDPSVLNDPKWHLFILDSSSTWKPLIDVTLVGNQSKVLLVDSADISTKLSPGSSTHCTSRSATASPEDMSLPSVIAVDKHQLSSMNGLWRGHPQRPVSTDLCHTSSPVGAGGRSSSTPPLDDEDEKRRRERQRAPHCSPLSIGSSTSGVVSDSVPQSALTPRGQPADHLVPAHAQSLLQSVHKLRSELDQTKREHKNKMIELQVELVLMKNLIGAAVLGIANSAQICNESKKVHGIEQFRKDRLKIMTVKEDYSKASFVAMEDLSDLQRTVEELRIDAVNRKCKIDAAEVEDMETSVHTTSSIIDSLKRKYFGLEFSLKDIMKRELEVIVAEEKFMQDEGFRLEEAVESCRKLSQTLDALKQLSEIQDRRTPNIPYIAAVDSPDRKALLESISAIFPNHQHRMESLELAEATHKWRKELHSEKNRLKKFENNLQLHKKQLRPTGYADAIDRRRQMKLKSMYMQERIQKNQKMVKERERHMSKRTKPVRRRNSDITRVLSPDRDMAEEQRQLKELKFIQEQRRKLEEDRLRQIEDRIKLEEMRRRQAEEQHRIDEEKRQQEEERRQLDEERRKQETTTRKKLENEQPQRKYGHSTEWEEYSKQLSSESPRMATLRKEMLWQQIQKQAQLELEKEEELEREKQEVSCQTLVNGTTGQASLVPILRKRPGIKDASGNKDRRSIGYFGEFEAAGGLTVGPSVTPLVRDSGRADSLPRQMHYQAHSFKSAQRTPLLQAVAAVSHDHEHKYHSDENLVSPNQNIYDPPWDQSRVASALHISRKAPPIHVSPPTNRQWYMSDMPDSPRTSPQHQHWRSLEDDRELRKPYKIGKGQKLEPTLSQAVQHNLLSQEHRHRSFSDHRLSIHSAAHSSPHAGQIPLAPTVSMPNEATSSYPGHSARFTQYPHANMKKRPQKAMNISYV